jgi:hypothetical protein
VVCLHLAVVGGDLDGRANGHAVAARAGQLQCQPVMPILADVVEEPRGSSEHARHNVLAAVVIEVAERKTLMPGGPLQVGSGSIRDVLELPVCQVAENCNRFFEAARGIESDVVLHV